MILLLAAAPLETAIIRSCLAGDLLTATRATLARPAHQISHPLMLAHTGIGQINMAMQLTRILTTHTPEAVILFGCGGAYPSSGLQIGETAMATSETLADTGVATSSGFIPLEQLNIPQDQTLVPQFKQCYQLSQSLLQRAAAILPKIPQGPFVTTSTCSGSPHLSEQLHARTAGICENMEGAAAAAICQEFNLPLLEIRGISNPTGTRDPQQWDISKGVEAAQNTLITLLKNWS